MERGHGAVVPAVDLAVDAIIELMLLRVRRERITDPHHVGDGVLIGGKFPERDERADGRAERAGFVRLDAGDRKAEHIRRDLADLVAAAAAAAEIEMADLLPRAALHAVHAVHESEV